MEKARNNLYAILNWFHHLETINLSYIKIERNIFKQLIDFIIGSDDLVREEVKNINYIRYNMFIDKHCLLFLDNRYFNIYII